MGHEASTLDRLLAERQVWRADSVLAQPTQPPCKRQTDIRYVPVRWASALLVARWNEAMPCKSVLRREEAQPRRARAGGAPRVARPSELRLRVASNLAV
jgi:hypothetical protein